MVNKGTTPLFVSKRRIVYTRTAMPFRVVHGCVCCRNDRSGIFIVVPCVWLYKRQRPSRDDDSNQKRGDTRHTHTNAQRERHWATGPRISFATAPRGNKRGEGGGLHLPVLWGEEKTPGGGRGRGRRHGRGLRRRKEAEEEEEEEVNRRVVGEDVLEARERRVRVEWKCAEAKEIEMEMAGETLVVAVAVVVDASA